jgi:Fe-S cluster biogenesis protein NfuA
MISDEKIIEQIEEVLEQLRPYFFLHGGNIVFKKYESGTVYVSLRGNCDGCPASGFTLKLMIEDALKKEVPQVEKVIEI